MKPEEAKPRDLDDLFEEGWKFKVGRIDGAGWFTAKETAEIAKAYGHAIRVQQAAAGKIDESPVRNERKYGSLFSKATRFILDYEKLILEWSK